MKVNLRILLVMLLGLTFLSTNAQSFIVKGGLNLSNMNVKDKDRTYSNDYEANPGFHVGIVAELPIAPSLYIEPGVLFATKGFKLKTAVSDGTYNLNYIDVPVNLKFKADMGNIALWGSAGPYLGLGLGGKSRTEVPIIGIVENDIKFGNDEDYKMFDFGLGIGAGVEYHDIMVGVNYNFGLANISTTTTNDLSKNNNVLAISIGYKF